jgi:hypothetical protein
MPPQKDISQQKLYEIVIQRDICLFFKQENMPLQEDIAQHVAYEMVIRHDICLFFKQEIKKNACTA